MAGGPLRPSAASRAAARVRRLLLGALAVASWLGTAGCQPYAFLVASRPEPPTCPWEADPAECLSREWPGYAGSLGVSDPLPSERAADAQATEDAVSKLLSQLVGVEVASELHVSVAEVAQGTQPGPSDSRVQVTLRRRFRVEGSLPEFEVLRRSVERRPDSYVVRVLVGVRNPARVRQAYEAALMSGLPAARRRLDAELASSRQAAEGPLEPLAVAVASLDAHLTVAERLALRSAAPAADFEAHRPALLEARNLLLARYHERLESLQGQDAYPVALGLTVRLARATGDPAWDSRVGAVGQAARSRAEALARQGAYEQALAVVAVDPETREYLQQAHPELAGRIAALQAQLEQARAASLPERVRGLRVLVRIPEEVLRARVPDPAVETEIVRRLTDAGFRVVDPLADAERRADILVTGEAFAQPAARMGGLVSARARAELKAIRTDTGEVLGSYAVHASGVDLTDETASKKALQQAAEKAGPWLVELLTRWAGAPAQRIELVVSGVGFGQAQALVQRVRAVEGVRSVQLKNFSGMTAWLDVEATLSPVELAAHLPGTLEVLRISGARVEAAAPPEV